MTSSSHRLQRAVATRLGFLLGITIAPAIPAQQSASPSLTVAQAIEDARRASADVRAAREAVAAAAARERQAGAYPNPTFSYGREQTSASGATGSQNIAAIEQRIELGGTRGARIESARARHHAVEARLAAVDAQVVFETTRAYAHALAADRRAQLAEQAAEAFTQALGISERRLAAGDVSGYAHRRIRLEAARYATVRAEAQLARRAARLALTSLVSEKPEAVTSFDVMLTDTLPGVAGGQRSPTTGRSTTGVSDSLIGLALRSRPDIRVLELEAAAARADAQLAARERVPAPAVSLGYKNESIPGADGTANGFVAGVSVPLPVWDRRTGAIAAADADSRRRVAEVDALRRRVAREVAEAYDAHVTLETQLTALGPQLGGETRTAMRAVQVAYSEGEVTLVEWLDAVRAYQEAETSFAALRAEALIRRAALERAIGVPLPPLDSSRIGAGAPSRD